MTYIYYFLVCIFVIFFVGISLKAKPLVSLIGGLAGGVSYIVYLVCGQNKMSYFLAALVLSLFSEILARVLKKPATIFMVLGIFPLVPGSALYRMMEAAIRSEYALALSYGGEALISIALMSVAIAFVPTIFRIVTKQQEKQ